MSDKDGRGRSALIIACERALGYDLILLLLSHSSPSNASDALNSVRHLCDKRTLAAFEHASVADEETSVDGVTVVTNSDHYGVYAYVVQGISL